jgi:3-dehydroquinate synthase
MNDTLFIESNFGRYDVIFARNNFYNLINDIKNENSRLIIDKNVYELYKDVFGESLKLRNPVILESSENIKSLEYLSIVVQELLSKGHLQRGHTLIAVGGGVIQDITCFLASTLFRGMRWHFHPTTLLAQADSCIGSKSSININGYKNILGTFYPPKKIVINIDFLKTLSKKDLQSGVGEIIKAHTINGPESLRKITYDYDSLFTNENLLAKYIFDSLNIKKNYIEIDEFDHNIRNLFNYGHTFGHAIESATKYLIPHGIAVTIGMDMANWTSFKLGFIGEKEYMEMHGLLYKNYNDYADISIKIEDFMHALTKDKKNTSADELTLILFDRSKNLKKINQANNNDFVKICLDFFNNINKNLKLKT